MSRSLDINTVVRYIFQHVLTPNPRFINGVCSISYNRGSDSLASIIRQRYNDSVMTRSQAHNFLQFQPADDRFLVFTAFAIDTYQVGDQWHYFSSIDSSFTTCGVNSSTRYLKALIKQFENKTMHHIIVIWRGCLLFVTCHNYVARFQLTEVQLQFNNCLLKLSLNYVGTHLIANH